jgi:hypothetical protein
VERGSVSTSPREARCRRRIASNAGRKSCPLQRDAGIRRGLRNVAERECQLDETSRVRSSDPAWRTRVGWCERPIASASGRSTHMPSTRRLRPQLRRGAERTDRPFGSRPAPPSHPRRTLPNASSDRSAPEDGPGDPITTTDLSAVGQGTPDAGIRDRMGGASPPGDRHVRTRPSLPAGRELVGFGSGKWILRAGSAEGDRNLGRMVGIQPVGVGREVNEPVSGRRSLREGERPREESTRFVMDLGRSRAGRRQGPHAKDAGGAARPMQRLPFVITL